MHGDTVLDASVAINLLWCGEPEIVLRAIPAKLIVPDVTSREVVRDPANAAKPGDPVKRLVDAGLMERRALTSGSLGTFVDLVGAHPPDDLGDGEAAAIALASEHCIAVALDDTKARRIARERFPRMLVVSSVSLFAHREVATVLGARLADVVFCALQQARMRVLPEDAEWVAALIGDARAAQCASLRRRRA